MRNQKGEIDWYLVGVVLCAALIVLVFVATNQKQQNDMENFMNGCLQDKKQYECDVLWSQTDASKQMRDLAIGAAAGAAIGAASSRR